MHPLRGNQNPVPRLNYCFLTAAPFSLHPLPSLNSNCFKAQLVKHLPSMLETWVQFLSREVPWRRKCQPIPVFLPEESHGQRSLAGYSPWDPKSRTQLSNILLSLELREEAEACFLQKERGDRESILCPGCPVLSISFYNPLGFLFQIPVFQY